MKVAFRFALVSTLVMLTGSSEAANLFKEENYRSLTGDYRARHIGDGLTVLVTENASAAASSNTKTDKSNNGSANLTDPRRQQNYSLGFSENFDGTGKISRTGRLLAQLSVTVTAVEPNGDLRIKGDQNIEINGEKQALTLEGRVRQIDISESNTIPSNRIADAKITYIGDGVLAESQHKGWLSRVFSFLGLI